MVVPGGVAVVEGGGGGEREFEDGEGGGGGGGVEAGEGKQGQTSGDPEELTEEGWVGGELPGGREQGLVENLLKRRQGGQTEGRFNGIAGVDGGDGIGGAGECGVGGTGRCGIGNRSCLFGQEIS
jgi:hypothetical protein